MARYFDAHTHVNFAAFREDLRETIQRAHTASVFLVNVGTQKDTSLRAVQIAREYEAGVYATVGLHPIHVAQSYHDAQELGGDTGFTSRGEEFDYEDYKNFAADPKVVAIGECGLDYYRISNDHVLISKQKDAFVRQIKLAYEVKKPLMIHCREAYDDLIHVLTTYNRQFTTPPGVVHFFSGTTEHAKKLLDLGFYFTFGGVITFARDYDAVIRLIPEDRILSETDAPYVTPAPHRGKRNEPAYVIYVVRKLAEIRGVPEEEMRAKIFQNSMQAFRMPSPTLQK